MTAKAKFISSLEYSFFLDIITFIIASMPPNLSLSAFSRFPREVVFIVTVSLASVFIPTAWLLYIPVSIFFKASELAPILFASSIAFSGFIPFAISFIFSFIDSDMLFLFERTLWSACIIPPLISACVLASAGASSANAIIMAIMPWGVLRDLLISCALASSSEVMPVIRQINSSETNDGSANKRVTKSRAGSK